MSVERLRSSGTVWTPLFKITNHLMIRCAENLFQPQTKIPYECHHFSSLFADYLSTIVILSILLPHIFELKMLYFFVVVKTIETKIRTKFGNKFKKNLKKLNIF